LSDALPKLTCPPSSFESTLPALISPPTTSNLTDGEVVPIPTLPLELIRNRSTAGELFAIGFVKNLILLPPFEPSGEPVDTISKYLGYGPNPSLFSA